MIKKILIFISFFMVSLSYGQTVQIPISTNIQQRDGKSFYVHKVQKSQTVYSIAKAYHVGIDEIYYANPEAKQGLKIGQELWIPTENKETEINKAVKQRNFDFFYHVASGNETFRHISSIYVIPERYIHMANPSLKEPLKEGEYVKIPVESAFAILDGKVASRNNNTAQYQGGLDLKETVPPTKKVNRTKNTFKPVKKAENSRPAKASHTIKQNFNPDIPVIKDYRHVVIMGETLESIAKKYGISVSTLKSVNPGLKLAVQGQRLRLPQTAKVPGYQPPAPVVTQKKGTKPHTNKTQTLKTPVTSKPEFITHTVQRKETLYSISRKYGVSLDDLYQANPGLTTQIKIGQTIRVPKKKITKPYLVYSSYRKTTLKKIARLYRMDYVLLKTKNPIVEKKVLPGQAIIIPLDKDLIEQSAQNESALNKPGNLFSPSENTETTSFTGRCIARPHTKVFHVALMIPLYLEETDSLDINQFMLQDRKNFKSFRFIQFLEGALLATDSLQKQGMKLDLHVYDVDEKLTKTSKVLSRPELKNMDLIIGPFYSRSFNQIALFANHFHIPIVNPLTFRNEVIQQFDDVVKVKPENFYQNKLITSLVKNTFTDQKIFLIYQDSFQDATEINRLRDSLQSTLPATYKIANIKLVDYGIKVTQREKEAEQKEQLNQDKIAGIDEIPPQPIQVNISDTLHPYFMENQRVDPETLKLFPEDSTQFDNTIVSIHYAYDSIHPFEENASVLRNNLIILYGTNKSFVMDAMNRLNILRDTFNIQMIGLPEWENFNNMDLKQMNNLNLTYPSSYFIDYQSPTIQSYQNLFKSTFYTDPNRYGVLGFDISYYFMESLFLYGNHMLNCLDKNQRTGLSTQFHFAPSLQNQNSYENTYWNILQIRNFKLFKLHDGLK